MGVNIASHDGARLTLTTPTTGADALLEILVPAAGDATPAILGISPARTYRGAAATPARLVGPDDLSGGIDLSVTRFLRLSVDGGEALSIDLAADADDTAAVPLSTLVETINTELGVTVAADEGGRLALTSPSVGASSRLVVEPSTSGDARETLFGTADSEAEGAAARPAEITGEVAITGGVDLSERAVLPIVTASGRADVSVAGSVPEATAADEIIAAIDASGRATASLTAEGQLRLTAPVDDPDRLEVPALRHFELQEYLAAPHSLTRSLRHGEALRPANRGVGDAELEIAFHAPCGTFAPGLVDIAHGWEVRYLAPLQIGETVRLVVGRDGGIEATLIDGTGVGRPVEPARVFAAPLLPLRAVGDDLAEAWRAGPRPGGTDARRSC